MIVKTRKINKATIFFILMINLVLFLYFQNNMITTREITIQSYKLPQVFENYKIVHLTDLHGKSFGKEQKTLVKKIKKAQPDLIVFTGDLVDSRRYNEEHSIKLIKEITEIAPVYYVTGNHEWRSGRFETLEKTLVNSGVKVLRNTSDKIEKQQDEIYIIGIDDPVSYYTINTEKNTVENALDISTKGIPSDGSFKILLAHRPELFDLYSQYNIDLVFSGHAHGGQIRLPFIGGLVAPHQGFLPKYTSGKYMEGNSIMIVNRGLGNSIFPQRLFNRPEIIVVRLIN
ncbi:hypothetical protein SAMN05660472_02235 [Natronincola ferrireducens]|uniref:Calcineurin-like phosphoesterase domain-containing protein n=2 Tax=Natronincola ferrireducens TaxID=393762 RepID=A0A1G9FSI3_9FIRM|nr:hypothetical protein SAMN05660472_02235 [Natronincola ferrireducens]